MILDEDIDCSMGIRKYYIVGHKLVKFTSYLDGKHYWMLESDGPDNGLVFPSIREASIYIQAKVDTLPPKIVISTSESNKYFTTRNIYAT
jgi:hypothetical protein